MISKEYLQKIDEVISNGKYKDNWESLSGHSVPKWYYRDKFGIFIHWGIYSVPAYSNEWYSRNMYNKKTVILSSRKTYGNQKNSGIKIL